MNYLFKISSCFIFLFYIFSCVAFATDAVILSSSDIIPFSKCIEGLKKSLSEYSLQIINIEEDLQKGRETLSQISPTSKKIIIAVGPQAAYVLSDRQPLELRIFCMVLNPVKLLRQKSLYPGVSLNIPPDFQLETIMEAFPDRKRIGVFYSKKSNQAIVDTLNKEAEKLGSVLVQFPIFSTNEIPAIINSNLFSIDVLLLIPDSIIKSTKIVKYIIKESLKRKIPAVGYNSWFAKNGAILSFLVNYTSVGTQTGRTAKKMILEGNAFDAEIAPPEKIAIRVDLATAKKLGIIISPKIIQRAAGGIKQ